MLFVGEMSMSMQVYVNVVCLLLCWWFVVSMFMRLEMGVLVSWVRSGLYEVWFGFWLVSGWFLVGLVADWFLVGSWD